MCHLQQAGGECISLTMLRPIHLRDLYDHPHSFTMSHYPMMANRILFPLLFPIGQISLPNTCPVCAHTPVSPDLCKPNKALRTTLKAFLRTEEKKREKGRQLASATATPASETPAQSEAPPSEATPDQNGTIGKSPSTQVVDDAPQPDIATSDEAPREDTLAESNQSDTVHANEDSKTAQPVTEV